MRPGPRTKLRIPRVQFKEAIGIVKNCDSTVEQHLYVKAGVCRVLRVARNWAVSALSKKEFGDQDECILVRCAVQSLPAGFRICLMVVLLRCAVKPIAEFPHALLDMVLGAAVLGLPESEVGPAQLISIPVSALFLSASAMAAAY